jgi:hypothetical protein
LSKKNQSQDFKKHSLEEDFQTPVDLVTQENTSVVAIKIFNETMSSNNFYKLYFPLTKSNSSLFYQDRMKISDSKHGNKEKETIQKLNDRFSFSSSRCLGV